MGFLYSRWANRRSVFGLANSWWWWQSFVQQKSNFISNEIDCTLAIIDSNKINFSLYPNPAKDSIEISSEHQLKTITIYNVLGKKVLEQSVDDNKIIIDVNHLSNGVYLLHLETDFGETISKKIIIEK